MAKCPFALLATHPDARLLEEAQAWLMAQGADGGLRFSMDDGTFKSTATSCSNLDGLNDEECNYFRLFARGESFRREWDLAF